MSKRTYDDLLDLYAEKFGEAFPTRMVFDPEEAMAIMEKCLETGSPYDPCEEKGYDPEVDY